MQKKQNLGVGIKLAVHCTGVLIIRKGVLLLLKWKFQLQKRAQYNISLKHNLIRQKTEIRKLFDHQTEEKRLKKEINRYNVRTNKFRKIIKKLVGNLTSVENHFKKYKGLLIEAKLSPLEVEWIQHLKNLKKR